MRLLQALRREPLDHPPLWIMRQAGRYLPEYRELRERYSFQEAVRDPEVATRITLQPLHRFSLDAAIVFQDIMTPLEAMGVEMEFAPGPRFDPLTVEEVADLPQLDLERVSFVLEALGRVRAELAEQVAVIGFAGGPVTLLAYLLEGGGSRDFTALRRTAWERPEATVRALDRLAAAGRAYLGAQLEAGADVVQLFDSWVGALSRSQVAGLALPAAVRALHSLPAPTIYYAPGAAHVLDLLPGTGATAYAVDWRLPLGEAWKLIGLDRAVQGNLDPAVLLTSPGRIRRAAEEVLEQAAARPGHIFNLGGGIHRDTPPEHVEVLAQAVRGE